MIGVEKKIRDKLFEMIGLFIFTPVIIIGIITWIFNNDSFNSTIKDFRDFAIREKLIIMMGFFVLIIAIFEICRRFGV